MTMDHVGDRQAAVDAVLEVNREDIAIVESCQRGRRSPAFNGGVFMQRQEATSLLVQRMITGRLLRHLGIDVDLGSLPVMDIHHELGPSNGT